MGSTFLLFKGCSIHKEKFERFNSLKFKSALGHKLVDQMGSCEGIRGKKSLDTVPVASLYKSTPSTGIIALSFSL